MSSHSSTYKRVVIHKLDKTLVRGFVEPASYLGAEGIKVLDRGGRLFTIPLNEVKGVFFVREFEGNPRRTERKVFHGRPRLAGLWVRMTFKDQEVLEGLISNNLLDISSLGFLATPPDLYSNNLRMFIPRSALTAIEALGVISDGAARRASQKAGAARPKTPEAERQIGLFSLAASHPHK